MIAEKRDALIAAAFEVAAAKLRLLKGPDAQTPVLNAYSVALVKLDEAAFAFTERPQWDSVKAAKYIREALGAPLPDGSYLVPGQSEWTFEHAIQMVAGVVTLTKRLKEEGAALRTQLDAMRASRDQQVALAKKLDANFDAYDAEVKRLRDKVARVEQLEQSNRALNNEITDLQRQLRGSHSTVAELRAENKRHRDRLTQYAALVDDVEKLANQISDKCEGGQ